MVWALIFSFLLHGLWLWGERPALVSSDSGPAAVLEVRLPPRNPLADAAAAPLAGDVSALRQEALQVPASPMPIAQGSAVAVMPNALVEQTKNPPMPSSTVNPPTPPDPVTEETARKAAEEAARQALEAKMLPYRAGGLDPGPVPLADIDPVYPEAAGKRQGIVRLTLLINEEGIVDEAIVVYSRPAAMFDEAAVTAFSQARFTPGKFLGIPVKSRLTVEVEFTPINRGGAVTGRGY